MVGIDGGGTHTRAALARADSGIIVGRGSGGPGNFHSGTRETLLFSVEEAVNQAFGMAGLLPEPVARIVAGLAGAGTASARREAGIAIGSLPWAQTAHIEVISDLELAFSAAFGSRAGVLLVAGTGSSCLARDKSGDLHQVGGWGALLDDDGSAFDLSRRALRALVFAFDGRGPSTALREAIFNQWGISCHNEFLQALRERSTPGALAGLARSVLDTAAAGDIPAKQVVEEATDGLVTMVQTALRKCGDPPPPVSLHGGLFATDAYREALERRIHSTFPSVKFSRLRADLAEAATTYQG